MADPIHSVHVPTAEHRASPAAHIAYRLDVQAAVRAWSVWRRYSQFDQLHRDLLRVHPLHPPPAVLPAKHYFSFTSTASSPAGIEQRRQGLEHYLQAILTDPDPRWRRTHEWREFLGVPTARAFTEDHFTAGSWMEELRAVQGALRECRALVHRREASAGRHDTAEMHRCTLDARRRLQGLAEQVRALDAGLRMLAIALPNKRSNYSGSSLYGTLGTSDDEDPVRPLGTVGNEDEDEEDNDRSCRITEGERARRTDLLEAVRMDLRTLTRLVDGRPVVASTDRRELLQQHDGAGSAYGHEQSRERLRPIADEDDSRSTTANHVVPAPVPEPPLSTASKRVFGRSQSLPVETAETRALDNAGVLDHQRQLMQRQDTQVAQFSDVLQRQRHIAQTVGDELDMQNQMLDELDVDVEQTTDKLARADRKLGKIH